LFDRSYQIAEFQKITDMDSLICYQRDAGNDIFQCLLGCERHCDATHTETCESGSRINAEVVESVQKSGEQDQSVEDSAKQAHDCR
jgi:hypothetical protein